MIDIPNDKQLILFDGVCNLCNTSIQYVIKKDKHNRFIFAALQSKVGESVIKQFGIDTTAVDSILLYKSEKDIYSKSTAALMVASQLGLPTNILGIFLIVPKFIRDWVYDFIAKNRYKWYGKKESCMVPTPELRGKFLE
ncbi:DUF393 domain-containing protein [Flavobacteriaceae bacterium MHTCC 0001]